MRHTLKEIPPNKNNNIKYEFNIEMVSLLIVNISFIIKEVN